MRRACWWADWEDKGCDWGLITFYMLRSGHDIIIILFYWEDAEI